MKMMRRILVTTIAMMAGSAHAQLVRIQPKAVVEPHQEVRLGDIATISGTDSQTAETLANTVILSGVNAEKTIRAENILMAVIAQLGNSDLTNKIEISGSAQCQITLGNKAITEAMDAVNDGQTTAMTRVTTGQQPAVVHVARVAAAPVTQTATEASVVTASVVGKSENADTLGKMIMARLSQDLATPPEDLRITFDTINPALDEVMTGTEKVWKFRPLSRALLGSVQFDAQLVEGNHVTKKLTVAVNVEKRVLALVAAMPIARGDLLSKDSYTVEEMYIDRKMQTLFTKDRDVVGLEAQREIAVGSMLDQRDFKAAQLAVRGDAITVIFVSGSLKVQVSGKAMNNGKLHDAIQVKNDKTGEVYQATLISKGMAVVGGNVNDPQEKSSLEKK